MKTIRLDSGKDVGKRADVFISENLDISRSQIKNLMKSAEILINGEVVKAGYILSENDEITIDIKEKEGLKAEPIPIDVLFEDDYMAIIRKPQGIVVHPGAGIERGTLVSGLMNRFGNLSNIDESRPGIVHRLDKDTSGLMIIAKNNEFYEKIIEEFKNRLIEKKYLAFVHGRVDNKGIVEGYIGRHHINRLKMTLKDSGGKYSKTSYSPLEVYSEYSLLDVCLHTGRTHQIRVHMASINHPIVGDLLYGRKNKFNIESQLLHSYYLKFIHPITKKEMEFIDDMPKNFLDFEKKLKTKP
ncbi:RluA family pseudouridine synthase [Peptoniphilus sp. GNH]|nr:pseudouridine synthase, RluA family [Clostridiales bacterium KA00134]UHR03105.1 RluA family pseudouridine synthase [Peptoniphilus sp. GNH]